MRLIAPYIRVRIAEDVFESGDRKLYEASVDLGEDNRSSKCVFSLYDPGLVIGGKYQDISFKSGGIEVPADLLGTKQDASSTPVAATAAATPGSGEPAQSSIAVGGGSGPAVLTRPTGTTSAAQAAYYNQVWQSMKIRPDREATVREAGETALKNIARYQAISAQTSVPWHVIAAIHYRESTFDFGTNLANGDSLKRKTVNVPAGRIPGVAPPYTFEQAAIDALNYDRRFKVNWGSIPDMCWFLESYNGLGYLNKGRPSPYLLSGSQHYDSGKYVSDGRYSSSTVDQQIGTLPIIYYILNSKRTMVAAAPPQNAPTVTSATSPLQTGSPVQEFSAKGTEIIIEIGFEPDQLIAYHFIHIGTDSTIGEKDVTTFTGQSIRWLMTRRTENKSYENITLRQLALSVCSSHNLKLEMEGNGPTYQFLDQTGITAYELLLRQCRSIGYSIKDEGNKLILKPSGRPEFTGIVLDYDIVINLRFGDKARGDRTPSPSTSTSSPPTPAAENKTVIDRQTGKVEQQKKEDKSGTGKSSSNGVTGTAAPPIVGNVKPSSAAPSSPTPTSGTYHKSDLEKKDVKTIKNANGSTTEITTITNKTIENGTITTIVEIQTKIGSAITKKVTTTTETTKGTTIETENIDANNIISKNKTSNNKVSSSAVDSLKLKEKPTTVATANPGTPTDATTGLPRQPIGAIDLADGRAEAIAISDEAKRIKGYESEATVITTPEILTLVPGSIIGISSELVPPPFDREWRVSRISHKFPGGISQIQFYTPQAAPPAQAASPQSPAPGGTTATAPTATPGKFIFPMPKGAQSIGDGFGTRPGRPPGYLHKILDVAAPQGTILVAMADGVVKDVIPNNGGAGNMMTITYGGGYESTYMHLMPGGFLVNKGAQVKQGQPVAKVGTTGASSGPHLHLRFLLNGNPCLLSEIGIDVLKMGLPVHRYNATCNKY